MWRDVGLPGRLRLSTSGGQSTGKWGFVNKT
jgi:hypothetical protein